jgi:hypothetical protein
VRHLLVVRPPKKPVHYALWEGRGKTAHEVYDGGRRLGAELGALGNAKGNVLNQDLDGRVSRFAQLDKEMRTLLFWSHLNHFIVQPPLVKRTVIC